MNGFTKSNCEFAPSNCEFAPMSAENFKYVIDMMASRHKEKDTVRVEPVEFKTNERFMIVYMLRRWSMFYDN